MQRRELLTTALPMGIAALGMVSSRAVAAPRGKALHVAHLTDVHITPDKNAPQGVEALYKHLFSRETKPEFVINSGDAVMAVDGNVGGAKAATQIALWQASRKNCTVPIYSALGNHDIWGGTEPTDAIPVSKKGSSLMVGVLEMPAPYYSYDRGGWHFIALDSMCNWPNYGTLTEEHIEWLEADLKKTSAETPVCVFAHLPIVSVTSSLYGDGTKKGNDVVVPGVWQQADCWRISEIFRKHPNVRLCLSGHMHTQDRCEYRGVWYICGGAASGAWWGGAEYGFPPCYGFISFYPDGHFDYEFVDYGWTARAWRGKQLANG